MTEDSKAWQKHLGSDAHGNWVEKTSSVETDWKARYADSALCQNLYRYSIVDVISHDSPHIMGEAAIAVERALTAIGHTDFDSMEYKVEAIASVRDQILVNVMEDTFLAATKTRGEAAEMRTPYYNLCERIICAEGKEEQRQTLIDKFYEALGASMTETTQLLNQHRKTLDKAEVPELH